MKNDKNKVVLLELAKRIKKLREDRNLTQAECYNDTGINFGRIERGVRDIGFTTLLKICKYFEISFEEFFKNHFEELD